jgi:hypothetical protein
MAKQKTLVTKHTKSSDLVEKLQTTVGTSAVFDVVYNLIYNNKTARKQLNNLLATEDPAYFAEKFRTKKSSKHGRRLAKRANTASELETTS